MESKYKKFSMQITRDPDIKNDGQEPSYLDMLTSLDWISKGGDELAGWHIAAETGLYEPGALGISPDSHWIYVKQISRRCDLCDLVFNIAKGRFIPSYALNCWKVVVKMWRVDHLFKLYANMEEKFKGQGWECKCGKEVREWTNYNYGGYFYCDSKKQGLKRYGQVKEFIDGLFGDEFWVEGEKRGIEPLILKRYCTEMELRTGPSDQWKNPPHWEMMEKHILSMINTKKTRHITSQPDYIKQRVQRSWLEHAWRLGDMTCLQFNNGRPYYPKTVTYHKEFADE